MHQATKASFFALLLAFASACATDEILEDESDDVDGESEISQASSGNGNTSPPYAFYNFPSC